MRLRYEIIYINISQVIRLQNDIPFLNTLTCQTSFKSGFLSVPEDILKFENRQLNIAWMSWAYFKVGPLLSLCEYLNDRPIFFYLRRVKSKVYCFTGSRVY